MNLTRWSPINIIPAHGEMVVIEHPSDGENWYPVAALCTFVFIAENEDEDGEVEVGFAPLIDGEECGRYAPAPYWTIHEGAGWGHGYTWRMLSAQQYAALMKSREMASSE